MEQADKERLARVETTLMNIDKRLFGNGQPGHIDQIHTRISESNKRIASLENWRWWVMGLGIGTGLGLGFISAHALEAMVR